MRIKRIELNSFKRFTHLTVEELPISTKLVVLVGPNGSGKTSFLEAFNHYYKFNGFNHCGDYKYIFKTGNECDASIQNTWYQHSQKLVKIEFHDTIFSERNGDNKAIQGHFYFRSAYRNEPDFYIDSMQRQQDPTQSIRLDSLIQNDQTVSANYQRLIANTISGIYNNNNDSKSVFELRNELIGKIRDAIERVFDDLKFSSLGDPLLDGNFYFTKGTTKDFSYKNLSAGEKSAFDLILDMVVQSEYYSNAVYCIDEPETHMHTKLQGKVLRELYLLVPGESQLWLSTHSIGMLQEAEEIEKEFPGTVTFLDFGDRDFDTDQVIRPAKIGKAVLDKFYELAFGDLAKLILPKTIVFCEGDVNGKRRKDFDKSIYSTIFADTHPDTLFISGGSCSNLENIEKIPGEIVGLLLKNVNIVKIIDRDDRSEQECKDLLAKGIKVLQQRNLESYLLDDSVIHKLCASLGKVDKYEECIKEKRDALARSIARGNAADDYKSASGEIYVALKKCLALTKCGNNADTFMRDTLSHLITPDMDVFKRLKNEIFGKEEDV